jgi:hypothetical protein
MSHVFLFLFVTCLSFLATSSQNSNQITCGKPSNFQGRFSPGENIEHGEFPWWEKENLSVGFCDSSQLLLCFRMVAVFQRDEKEVNASFGYICGGSLVSGNKIVTGE